VADLGRQAPRFGGVSLVWGMTGSGRKSPTRGPALRGQGFWGMTGSG